MFEKIIGLFFPKKREYSYPHEFAIVKYNENAKKFGIFNDMTKIIEYHYGDLVRLYPYTEEKIEILHDDGVPVFDETEEEFKISIVKKVNPALISYEHEVD